MATDMIYRLTTHDGSVYHIVDGQRVELRAVNLTITFNTMARLLLALGGMVEWETWSEDARLVLNQLNGGRGAI